MSWTELNLCSVQSHTVMNELLNILIPQKMIKAFDQLNYDKLLTKHIVVPRYLYQICVKNPSSRIILETPVVAQLSRALCLHCFHTLVSYSTYSSTLKKEANFFFETLVVFQRTSLRYISGDINLHNYSCDDLIFCVFLTIALDGNEWPASRSGRFTPRKEKLLLFELEAG